MTIKLKKRDDKLARLTLSVNPKTDEVIAEADCRIIVPTKYFKKELGIFGDRTEILAVYVLMLPDGTYGISKQPCKVRLGDTSYSIEKLDEEDVYVFYYSKGDVVLETTDIVKDKLLPYYIYEYFINRGYVPPFIEYTDMLLLFEEVERTTGKKVGSNKQIIKIIISLIARDPEDPSRFYRQALNEGKKVKPKWIALNSVLYGPRTVTAKLAGAYFSPALKAALVTDNNKPEILENIYRSN